MVGMRRLRSYDQQTRVRHTSSVFLEVLDVFLQTFDSELVSLSFNIEVFICALQLTDLTLVVVQAATFVLNHLLQLVIL